VRTLEAALAERDRRESFAQALADHQPNLLAYVDRELRLHFANRAYLDWFGKTREQVLGQRVPDVLGRAVMQPDPDVYDRVFAGEAVGRPAEMPGADGRAGHFWIYRVPDLLDATVRGYYFIATDITELRRAVSTDPQNQTARRVLALAEQDAQRAAAARR